MRTRVLTKLNTGKPDECPKPVRWEQWRDFLSEDEGLGSSPVPSPVCGDRTKAPHGLHSAFGLRVFKEFLQDPAWPSGEAKVLETNPQAFYFIFF